MKKALSVVLLFLMVLCVSSCGKSGQGNTIKMKANEPVQAGSIECTFKKVEFTNKTEYRLPDSVGEAQEGYVYGIATYSIKNIGKTGVPIWKNHGFIAVGSFVYGDGYTYENGIHSKKPYPYYIDERENEARTIYSDMVIEPLTPEVEYIVLIILPENIVESADEELAFEIDLGDEGDNKRVRYIIPNEDRVIIVR